MWLKRKKSSEIIFDDIMSIKVTKPFKSSSASTGNKLFRNSGKQKDNCVLKPRYLQLRPLRSSMPRSAMEHNTSAEKDGFNIILMQEFAIQAEKAIMLKDISTLGTLGSSQTT